MGSYFGHGLEATIFLLLGFWWMLNSFPSYIKARRDRRRYVSKCSYPWPWITQIPFEAIIKLIFTLMAFSCELVGGGTHFVDSDNQFVRMGRLQHMSIYGMFTFHALCDLFSRLGAPLPSGTDWASGALAFAWYSVCFTYHTLGDPEIGLEHLLHVLPIYILYLMAVSFIIETVKPSWFLAQICRVYCALVLGSWYWHTAVIMYQPFPYPGNLPNPVYPREDIRNVQFVVAAFGFHLTLNAAFIVIVYVACAAVIKRFGSTDVENMDKYTAKDRTPLLQDDDF